MSVLRQTTDLYFAVTILRISPQKAAMTTPASALQPRRARTAALTVVLSVTLALALLVSAGTGQLHIAPTEVLGSLLHRIGITALPLPEHPTGDQTLWAIRFPRVVMSALVGAGLALSGLLMQAIFGNPLAEPGIIGISAGAAFGASIAIVFGLSFLGGWTVAAFAFASGLLATLTVYFVSRSGGKTEVVTLVLTGIAVNAVGGAGIALLTFLGSTQSREQIVFWQLGSIAGSRWPQIAVVAPVLLLGVFASAAVAKKLDLLALGERNARHLGVNVEALRIGVIVLVALVVGVSVAFTGVISFVGLVVPHLMRMVLGPAHGPLVVTSAVGGALLLTLADLGARTLIPLADLPIGMLTSLVGGPFFFWLLRRTRKSAGGWG